MPSWRGANALYIARKLGLTSGLKLCLDAGDSASLPASPTKWLDLSGNGYDFELGADSTHPGTDEPTATGTANQLAAGNYLGFDGGDFLRYDTTNEAWMQNLHKENALFTLAFWTWVPNLTTSNGILGTHAGTGAKIGISYFLAASEIPVLTVGDGSGAAALDINAGIACPQSAFCFHGVSVDEAAGVGLFMVNDAPASRTATYATPSASDATHTLELGALGNAAFKLENTSRIAMACVWEGVALTQAQFAAFFNATRGRFGI